MLPVSLGSDGELMYSVLIVEDNLLFRSILREMLAARFPSIEIEEAPDGEVALDKIRRREPDLVFMDIELPGKNGLELTRIIRRINPKIRIVVISSCDLPEYSEAASLSGASHFISKEKVTGDLLIDVVKSIFSSVSTQIRSPFSGRRTVELDPAEPKSFT